MKTKKYFLILSIVAVILCTPALGKVELSQEHEPEIGLIGSINPALAGVEDFYVFIVQPDS